MAVSHIDKCCEFSDTGIFSSCTWLKIDEGRQNEAAVMDLVPDQSEGTPLKHWYVFFLGTMSNQQDTTPTGGGKAGSLARYVVSYGVRRV